MKTWNEVFYLFLAIFLSCSVGFVAATKVSLGNITPFGVSALVSIPYFFCAIMIAWANKIIAEREKKIETSGEAVFAFSNLSRPSLNPSAACNLIINLIGSLGRNWWGSFGKEILFKLFYERPTDNAEKIKYLQDFIIEASSPSHQKKNGLLSMIFSVVKIEELARVLASTYYLYAVNLVGGTFTVSAEYVTRALKEEKIISKEFLCDVSKYAKEITAEHYTGKEEQKILGIIEGEITKTGI